MSKEKATAAKSARTNGESLDLEQLVGGPSSTVEELSALQRRVQELQAENAELKGRREVPEGDVVSHFVPSAARPAWRFQVSGVSGHEADVIETCDEQEAIRVYSLKNHLNPSEHRYSVTCLDQAERHNHRLPQYHESEFWQSLSLSERERVAGSTKPAEAVSC